jgi:hypothetical protein
MKRPAPVRGSCHESFTMNADGANKLESKGAGRE